MNIKAAIGIAVALVILGGAVLFTRRASAPAPLPEALSAPTTQEAATSSASATVPETPVPAASEPSTAAPKNPAKPATGSFDLASYTTADPNPVITGTANVGTVQVVIQDGSGVGIVGSLALPVVNGHWRYRSTRALAPGSYTVTLGGIDQVRTAPLIITR